MAGKVVPSSCTDYGTPTTYLPECLRQFAVSVAGDSRFLMTRHPLELEILDLGPEEPVRTGLFSSIDACWRGPIPACRSAPSTRAGR